jgi:predicted GNAT family acetyltransferase
MRTLSQDYYGILQDKVSFKGISPEPLSIISKNNPGEVFVDDVRDPQTALIWSYGIQGFYLIGRHDDSDTNNEIVAFFDRDIALRAKEIGYKSLEVSGDSVDWNEPIADMFKHRKMSSWKQHIYLTKVKVDTRYSTDIEVRSVKNADIERLTNTDILRKELLQFWETIESLQLRGNCFFAVDDNRVIGMCYTGFVTDSVKVIGIETLEEYRRRNVGYTLAARCMNEIIDEGCSVYWDCMEKNIPSNRLASKLGLERTGEYICHGFPI